MARSDHNTRAKPEGRGMVAVDKQRAKIRLHPQRDSVQ
jgi:hypothetical protein